MNRNANVDAAEAQDSLDTDLFLVSYGISFLNCGLFFVINFGLRIMMVLGGKSLYLGVMSPVRIPNNYSPSVIRFIYYIDHKVVSRILTPALVLLATGVAMLIIRHIMYKAYVRSEVFKEKKKNVF